MELAEAAVAARLRLDFDRAQELTREAFSYERDAAVQLAASIAAEPTRAVLHRSAATLALECGELREAERLAAAGLAGNPPEEIADELRELFERVNFHRHLDLRGVVLDPGEFQLSIAGNAVAPGFTVADAFIHRVQLAERIVHRTSQRLQGEAFREKAHGRGDADGDIQLYMTQARAASYAVTLRLGSPANPTLPGLEDPFGVVDELVACLDLFARGEDQVLRRRIGEEPYYNSFVGLARQLEPDGEKVAVVGFTAVRNGQEVRVALTRGRRDAQPTLSRRKTKGPARVVGELRHADSMKPDTPHILVVDDEGKPHKVLVPPGQMVDVVKPLWEDRVAVTGEYKRGAIHMDRIERLEGRES